MAGARTRRRGTSALIDAVPDMASAARKYETIRGLVADRERRVPGGGAALGRALDAALAGVLARDLGLPPDHSALRAPRGSETR